MLRTQIYLPEELRMDIDALRKETKKSLAEYARVALQEQVKKDKKKKVDLKMLADAFIGSSTKTDAEIEEWLDWIQEEKRLVDEKIDSKWENAGHK